MPICNRAQNITYFNDTMVFFNLIHVYGQNMDINKQINFRPHKLPRDITHIAIACVYHPPQANHKDLKHHLCQGYDTILTKHPGAGIAAIGDFNRFPDNCFAAHYGLKQIVKIPTRENRTLDKCFTNIESFYEKPTIRAQLGKSDHLAVLFTPQQTVHHDLGTVK